MPGIEYIWFANVQTAHRCLSQFAPLTNTAEELTLEETITNTSTSYFLSRPPKRYPTLAHNFYSHGAKHPRSDQNLANLRLGMKLWGRGGTHQNRDRLTRHTTAGQHVFSKRMV